MARRLAKIKLQRHVGKMSPEKEDEFVTAVADIIVGFIKRGGTVERNKDGEVTIRGEK